MPKRAPKKAVSIAKGGTSVAELGRALSRRTKAELVAVLLELAQADRGVWRRLEARFDVAPATDGLVAATQQAIADATAFDPRDMNRNFAYDAEAYGAVKRNLGRLIAAGAMRQAMQLALELMKRGSHQVEMSDEGLMTEDIEDCLRVLLDALAKSDLPADEGLAWCQAMRASDRVGFIARQPLESLRSRLQSAAAP